MKQSIISVIVPCYNVENYIDRCLESIVNQTIGSEHLQIILINDASTDHTLDHMHQWEQKYPENILLVDCAENHKLGAARNIGMQYVTGEYVSFVDSDDVLDVTMFSKMYERACQCGCDVVECEYKEFWDGDELSIEKRHEDYYIELDTVEKRKAFIISSLKTAVWGRLYKTNFLKNNNLLFLEDVYYEDCHYSGLAMMILDSYCSIGETLYYYYQNSNGIILSTKNMEKVKWEIDVEKQLVKDLITRKILSESLEPYHEELEFYVTVKGCLDAIGMLADAKQMNSEWMAYLIHNLITIFPMCTENYYLNKYQPFFWNNLKEIVRAHRNE